MVIRAVVLDIGGVLEVNDDRLFPEPFERRHGLAPGSVEAAAASFPGHPGLGEIGMAEVRATWQRELGLSGPQVDELVEDFWRWYVGTLDRPMLDWFAGLRPRLLTGILSNSAPDARERERCWGFEDVTDDIVYSHEVGLLKPDPAVFELTARRLGVRPAEIVFVDDQPGHVQAARTAGWHAVVHVETARTIAEVERIIAEQGA
ncbi:HAD-IA family hydrolase [Nocardioides sp. MAHUQ-72]|uniref:HAD-IA family hydrolase n=1 Tax=unclassified Nocardioides TaxID=2615069 RepID=UPI003607E9B7